MLVFYDPANPTEIIIISVECPEPAQL